MTVFTKYSKLTEGTSSNGQWSNSNTGTFTSGPLVQDLDWDTNDSLLVYTRAGNGFPGPNSEGLNFLHSGGVAYNGSAPSGSSTAASTGNTQSPSSTTVTQHAITRRSSGGARLYGAYAVHISGQRQALSSEQTNGFPKYIQYSTKISGNVVSDQVYMDAVNNVANAATSSVYTAGSILRGPSRAQLVSCTGSVQTSLDGSTGWSSANKTFNRLSTVYMRMTSSASHSTTVSGGITVGNKRYNPFQDTLTWSITTLPQDVTVDAFNFGNFPTGVALGSYNYSYARILGFTGTLQASISANTGSDLRFHVNSSTTRSNIFADFTTAPKNITPGQYIHVRTRAHQTVYGAQTGGTISVGGQTDDWKVTTLAQDTAPDPYNYVDTANAEPGGTVTQYQQISGIDPTGSQPVALAISGCDWGLSYYIAGNYQTVTYNNPTSIILDAPLRLWIKQTASSSFFGQSTASVKVGTGAVDTATVTTRAPDLTPNTFSLGANATGQARNTNFDRTATITGFETTLPVTISSITGTASFKVNNGSFSTAQKTVSEDDTVTLRVTSSNSFSTFSGATITAGTGSSARSASFGITTLVRDNTPVGWTVANVTNAQLNVQHYYIQQINGINDSVSVTATGTAGALFKTSASATYSASGYSSPGAQLYITNGQYLHVAISTASSYSTERNITTTVGTAVDTWRVTTRAATSIPNSYSFANATSATPSSVANTFVEINGMESGTTQASIQSSSLNPSGTQIAVNGSAAIPSSSSFTTSPVNINNGQYLHVRSNAPSTYSTSSTVTIDVGGVDRTWTITTVAAPSGGGTPGSGQSGTAGDNTHGLEIFTANGTEVFSSNLRNQSIAVFGSWSFSASGQSTTFTCADANDASKILIIVRGASITSFNSQISLATTSTGFTLSRVASSSSFSGTLSGTVLAIRIS